MTNDDSPFSAASVVVQASRERRRPRGRAACRPAPPVTGTGSVMDDAPPTVEGPRLDAPDPALPEGFVPLRLLLQPGGLCVELSRPDMVIGRHSSADVRMCLP